MEKKWHSIILTTIIGSSILLLFSLYKTIASYQTVAVGNISSNIAFYLVKTGYQTQQVYLSSLVPSNEPYVYNFSVSNKDEDKISDVDIEYTLKIISTTNLPLRFELYMNEDYTSNNSTNLVTNENTTIEYDEYGTIFKTITLDNEELLFNSPKTNNYTLLIYYGENNIESKYQDTIESIKIVTDSKQIIE